MRALLFIFILTLGFESSLVAQDPNNLAVDGTVKDELGGRITGATVALFQDGAELKRVTTGNNGRFDLYLDFGHEYMVEISKTSFVTKKLYLNTNNVPEDEQLWGYEFGGFVVDMFKKMDGVDYSILDQPIGKVYYEPNVENFVDDKLYTRQIKAEVDRLESAQKAKIKAEEESAKRIEADYLLAIKDAQSAIDDGDYLTAKDNLLAAQSLKSDSKVASQMLSQVEAKLNSEGATQEKYLSVLASADQAYGNQDYSSAVTLYQEALTIKPTEEYPKNRLKESQDLLAKMKAQQAEKDLLAAEDKKYNDEIAKADAAYGNGEFLNARVLYQNALKLKDDQYPKSKLKEIEIRLAELASEEKKKQEQGQIDAAYADKIDKANTAFGAQNYELAKQHYQAASSIKPNEAYPKEQLALIESKVNELAQQNKLKADQAKVDADYKTAIAQADKFMLAKDYTSAQSEYKKALTFKPKEVYPNEQLTKIDQELKRLAALASENEKREQEAKLQKEYNDLILQADKSFAAKKWEDSKDLYKKALALKSNEKYPKDQLAQIETEISKANNLAAVDKSYNEAIALADKSFDSGDFKSSISNYENALKFKPTEAYPTNRIKEAQEVIKERERVAKDKEAQAIMDAQYADLIKEADAAFVGKNYTLAISKCEGALKLKSEQYPKSKIEEIKAIQLEEEKANALALKKAETLRKYQEAITKADQQFASKNYQEARATYNLAAGFKADENYPKSKISEIDKLVAQLAQDEASQKAAAELNAQYDALIKQAQAYLDAADYRAAKGSYTQAQQVKPNEAYPGKQIAMIDSLIAEREAKEAKANESAAKKADYDRLMIAGNEAMVSKNYVLARTSYNGALQIFPSDESALSKLKIIDELERKAEQDKIKSEYNALVAIADKAFLAQNYEEALEKYNQALNVLPGQSHAEERINKCSELIAELSRVDAQQEEDNKRRVIEETFDEGRTKVTIRRVIVDGREQVYKRVVHSWGGKYYFLDEQPITELVWSRETVK